MSEVDKHIMELYNNLQEPFKSYLTRFNEMKNAKFKRTAVVNGKCVSFLLAKPIERKLCGKTYKIVQIDFTTLPEYRHKAYVINLMNQMIDKLLPDAMYWITAKDNYSARNLVRMFSFIEVDPSKQKEYKKIYNSNLDKNEKLLVAIINNNLKECIKNGRANTKRTTRAANK